MFAAGLQSHAYSVYLHRIEAAMSFEPMFSSRINSVQPSFIREILKAADDPNVISFAGGLPDKQLFPLMESRPSQVLSAR